MATTRWEELSKAAQTAYHAQKYKESIFLNRCCLSIALEQFDTGFTEDPNKALAAILVSYFNLSDGYSRLKDIKNALSQLEKVSFFLRDVKDNQLLTEKKHDAFLHAERRYYLEYKLFIKEHKFELNNNSSLANIMEHDAITDTTLSTRLN